MKNDQIKKNIIAGKARSTIPAKKESPKLKKTVQLSDEFLEEIHKKIISSSALNGGFDILMFKIENIDNNQKELVEKVDKIHDAIYDQDAGIFSKINELNLSSSRKFNEADQKILELSSWKNHKEKDEEKIEDELDETTEKLLTLEKTIENLQNTKNNVWGVFRWLLVAIAGGSLTMFFKWLETRL